MVIQEEISVFPSGGNCGGGSKRTTLKARYKSPAHTSRVTSSAPAIKAPTDACGVVAPEEILAI